MNDHRPGAETMSNNQGYIRITRPSGYWADRLRSYRIVVDGEDISGIRDGERKQVAVSAGARTVHLRVDWGRSQKLTLDVEPGQSAGILCWPNARFFTWPFFLTVGRTHYIGISEDDPQCGDSSGSQ
jgi:hypothetical protein